MSTEEIRRTLKRGLTLSVSGLVWSHKQQTFDVHVELDGHREGADGREREVRSALKFLFRGSMFSTRTQLAPPLTSEATSNGVAQLGPLVHSRMAACPILRTVAVQWKQPL